MSRPWTPTPEDEREHAHWSDFAAFDRWFAATIDDPLPESEPGIWDALNGIQQAYLYSALAKAFDATGGPP